MKWGIRFSRRSVWNWIAATTMFCAILIVGGEARSAHRLIGQEDANRLGLKRAWFTQVRLNSARNHIERAILTGDRLTVLTTAGVVQELNALTGETYWIAPIGKEDYPSLGPAATDKNVALVNGSTLYVLDRADGKAVLIRQVGSAPGAAPALSEEYVFVPLVTGRIEGYSLRDPKAFQPWYYQSFGRAMVAPLTTPDSLVWTTDAGYLYVGRSNIVGMRYKLEIGSDIVAPPTAHPPYIYVAAVDGDLFAMNETSGKQLWKYSTGFPITRAAAGVADRVFVTSDEPAMHCIDAKNGNRLWTAPHIVQFSAASKDRVYGVNDLGAFVVLDGKTGAGLARMATDYPIKSLVNSETDRVYLISDDGMVECLHEVGLPQPIYHNPKPEPAAKDDKKAAPAAGSAAPPAATKPAETGGEMPAAKAAEPADAPKAGEKPPAKKNDFGNDDNPFGN
jgi:outer membrane protein assembly factor BamB